MDAGEVLNHTGPSGRARLAETEEPKFGGEGGKWYETFSIQYPYSIISENTSRSSSSIECAENP